MKIRSLSIAVLAICSFAALGQTSPASVTLPKDWSSIRPGHSEPYPLMAPNLTSPGPKNVSQNTLTLLQTQTVSIINLDDRVKKLEKKIEELETQLAGVQK